MLTVNQAQNSAIANVAGVDPTSPQFYAYLNEAGQTMMALGDWWATVVQMVGLIAGGGITWPYPVDTVLALTRGRGRLTGVTNFWYSFTEPDGQFQKYFSDPDWFGSWGPNGGFRGRSVCEFSGTQCLFAGPTPANPFALQITCDSPQDYGLTITIYGYDVNGIEVTSLRPDNTIQKGILLTLSGSPPNTGTVLSVVTGIAKDVTTGQVRAWSYVAGQPIGNVVGIFGGGQTSPEYQFSRIGGCDPCCVYHVDALVKLAYYDVGQPGDILPISNPVAYKSMIQAIRAREAGNDEKGDEYEKTAIRRLNMELNNKFPLDQMVIQNLTFNAGGHPHRRLY